MQHVGQMKIVMFPLSLVKRIVHLVSLACITASKSATRATAVYTASMLVKDGLKGLLNVDLQLGRIPPIHLSMRLGRSLPFQDRLHDL